MFDKTTEKLQQGINATVAIPAKNALMIALVALGIAVLALMTAAFKAGK